MACSSESREGFCSAGDWSCTPQNIARTCGTFGQKCVGLSHFPNASISDFGHIQGKQAMMKEIFHRGPIACASRLTQPSISMDCIYLRVCMPSH